MCMWRQPANHLQTRCTSVGGCTHTNQERFGNDVTKRHSKPKILYNKFTLQKCASIRMSKRGVTGGPTQPASSSHAGVWSVTVHRGDDGFGLLFGGAKNEADAQQHGAGVFISGVKLGGVAEGVNGITVGPQIVKLNGVDTTKMHVVCVFSLFCAHVPPLLPCLQCQDPVGMHATARS
jgi:hypothetical protein